MKESYNQKNFPSNIFPPTQVFFQHVSNIDSDKKHTLYKARFNNLHALYTYLNSNPKINDEIFEVMDSDSQDLYFAGKSFNETLENLVSLETMDVTQTLRLQSNMVNARNIKTQKYKTTRTVAGGYVNVPAYCAGSPMVYEVTQRVVQPKFIKIYATLSYEKNTTEEQIINRAIIIANIVKALEQSGYIVDLNTVMLSKVEDEIAYIIVQIKKHNEFLNMSNFYKTQCNREFLRRILFRVLETMDFKRKGWGWSYGLSCSEAMIRELLQLEKDDILIQEPIKLNIKGEDLIEDFNAAIETLGLENIIAVKNNNPSMVLKLK